VYSLLDKTWTTYGDFCGGAIGSQVFSSDGSKIAFAARSRFSSDHSDCIHRPIVLQILDIATGKLTPIPYNGEVSDFARLSCSPDGKYLVGQIVAWKQIVVIDVGSGSARNIAEGMNPSWSPKGDWIAYEHDKGLKCMLIHPDGTGAKVVLDLEKRFHVYRTFLQGAVWSPDGEKLLLNEAKVKTEASNDYIPLDPTSAQTLLDWKRESSTGLVFPSPVNGGCYNAGTIQQHILRRAFEKLGLANKGLGWHTFRHTYRAHLDEMGAPIGVQQKLMRHCNVATTMNVYGNASSKAKLDANSKVVQMAIAPQMREAAAV